MDECGGFMFIYFNEPYVVRILCIYYIHAGLCNEEIWDLIFMKRLFFNLSRLVLDTVIAWGKTHLMYVCMWIRLMEYNYFY